MKTFSGCFNKAEFFRKELKKGAPDSIFAIAAFVILSLISFMAFALTAVWLVGDREVVGELIAIYLALNVFTFIYNVIKAAFECFLDEREQVFDTLRND